jgi:hypothetical protein
MSDTPISPSFLRRAIGTTALYVVGIPMIVIGMLLMLTLVAVDKVERRSEKQHQRSTTHRQATAG